MGKINSLSLDLETYSDVDLNKCGVYKYAQSHAFEILLFGVSVNGGEVQVYDLAQGESVPMEIVKALTDNSVLKWAFNASFERVFLSVWLQRYYPQYFESYSIHEDTVGDYLAPLSMALFNGVVGIYGTAAVSCRRQSCAWSAGTETKEGKDLICYFCVLCRPTQANGGRTRNLPEHDADKWETFKASRTFIRMKT